MDLLPRHHTTITGRGSAPIVFSHGFGCDQQMWRFVAPAFEATHRVVLFDHAGAGRSDATAWDATRHASLAGYAEDVAALLEAADLRDAVFVGHSVSAMIGVLASLRAPGRIGRLVLVCPSPRYLNDPPDYVGGFERADIDALMDMMDGNMIGWADFLAPVVIGPEPSQQFTGELKSSFCAGDPYITRRFAATTFLADNRADLPRVTVPALILQCAVDAIAPPVVGDYVHAHLKGSTLRVMDVAGHCPHLTHPDETTRLIRAWLDGH